MSFSRERTRTFAFEFKRDLDLAKNEIFLAFTAKAKHSGIEYAGKVLSGPGHRPHMAQVSATTWKDRWVLFDREGKPNLPETTIPQFREEMEALSKELFSNPKVREFIGSEAAKRILKAQQAD